MSPLKFSYLFLVLLTCSLPLVTSQPCNKADMLTILSIKKSFGNPTLLSSWDAANAAKCCSFWRGIVCDTTGRITSVGIVETNVTGPIPPAIGDLSSLTTLYLYNLPNLVGQIPDSISKLTSLTQLTISNTAVSGNIPAVLGNLPKLNDLDLSYNKLTGTIPKSFTSVNFRRINLNNNNIAGDASVLFGLAKNALNLINLSWNQLQFDMSSMQFPLSTQQMDLSHNKIGGSIPQQLANLKNLSFVNFSYNKLCGPIPKLTSYSPVASEFEHNKCLCGAPLPACHRSLI